jgi:hypothetical protein
MKKEQIVWFLVGAAVGYYVLPRVRGKILTRSVS